MGNLFDLNIETVLDSWTIADALREIIANAIDEQTITNTQPVDIFKDDAGELHIRDYGRGIRYIHFTQNENNEKLKSTQLIGKFGVGFKDALAVLWRHNCRVRIISSHNYVTTTMATKAGFNVQTLHAKFEPTEDITFIGTDFIIDNLKDEDIEDAKSRFLIFNNLKLLETTKYGDVYKNE